MSDKVNKLEDLKAWQEAKVLAVGIYRVTVKNELAKDYNFSNQLRRAAVSVPSNIAEGYGRGGNKEFVQFLSIAKGSLYEIKTQLEIANELKYIDENSFVELSAQAVKVIKIVSGLLAYIKESDFRGSKFAEPEATYLTTLLNQEYKE